MYVKKLEKDDDNKYIEFLDTVSQANPSILGYHYPIYRDMMQYIQVGEPLYFGVFNNDEIVGVLPGFIKRNLIGTVYCSLPFFGPNAGILTLQDRNEEIVHELLLKNIIEYLSSSEDIIAASIYTPFLFNKFELYEKNLKDFIHVDKFTQYLYLPEIMWNSKVSYDIRKAQKLGVTISNEINQDVLDGFYNIYYQNCIDYSIPLKPKETIQYLADNKINGNNVSFYFAYYEGKMIGGLIMIYSKLTASYYMPCTLSSDRMIQSSSLIIDTAVNEARNRGIKYWNWESSPEKGSGVFQFKKKWGSIEDNYKIYLMTFCNINKIKELGKEKIMENFKYFFVYPFNKLI